MSVGCSSGDENRPQTGDISRNRLQGQGEHDGHRVTRSAKRVPFLPLVIATTVFFELVGTIMDHSDN